MVGPRHTAEEEADHLVADELVDQAVVIEDRRRPDPVEVTEEVVEFCGSHPFAHSGRAPDVREEQADRDLGARRADLAELPDAVLADGRVARESFEPEVPQDRAARARERGSAQLAPRCGGEPFEPPAIAGQAGMLAREDASEILTCGSDMT